MGLFNSAREYHKKTKFAYSDVKDIYHEYAIDDPPRTYKEPSGDLVIDLPKDWEEPNLEFIETQKTGFKFAPYRLLQNEAVTLQQLSQLLFLTNGITQVRDFENRKFYLRAAPSASGLYSTEIYVLANNVEKMEKGFYYFHPIKHQLIRIAANNLFEKVTSAGFSVRALKNAPVIFFFSSVFSRNQWKFKNRAYRYCLQDAGYMAENLVLAAAGLDLSCNLVGDFIDKELNQIIGAGEDEEAVVLVASAGKDGGGLEEDHYRFGLITSEEDFIGNRFSSLIKGIHQNSGHFQPESASNIVDVTLPLLKKPHRKAITEEIIKLPVPDSIRKRNLQSIIESRRSAHNFVRAPISLNDLSIILNGFRHVPVLYNYPAFYSYIIVNDVDGLSNGVYLCDPEKHELELRREGTFRGDVSYLTLAQDAVFNCSVAIFFSTDFEDIDIFGNRGYRYAHLNIGMLGESVYLNCNALGLGARGIGNFFDDDINAFLNVREEHEKVLGGVIIGRV